MFFICKTGVPGPPFLSAFLASSCPLQGCLTVFFPSLSAFASRFVMHQLQWKFCSIIFLTPCPFSPNASYLKNELFVFFQEICLRKVLAAPRSWEALETAQAGAVTSDVFPSPPHATRHRGILTLHLFYAPAPSHPTLISHSLQR